MHILQILLPTQKLFLLDYLAQAEVQFAIGDIVIVPFRNKTSIGIVWSKHNISQAKQLKTVISKIHSNVRLDDAIINFMHKASRYYITELCAIAKLVLPVDISSSKIKPQHQKIPHTFHLAQLSQAQNVNLSALRNTTIPSVIYGVTGSGKTEVYFHLIAEFLSKDKQVLVMLPEIALSNHIIKHFTHRFGFTPVVWNSSVSTAKKQSALLGIINGDVKMVIGARSSLFLPYSNLGLIVVDEEHDQSYKQETGVLYNARDMAVLRANLCNAKVVLCSATPSIETIYNAQINKYHLIKLEDRYHSRTMPTVEIINMRDIKRTPGRWLSNLLVESIKNTLSKKEQVLLFLNRRGYAPLLLCKSCGYRFTCIACSAWLVLHKTKKRLECHHCGYFTKIDDSCPSCASHDNLICCGPGVERIEEEILTLFPNNKIAVISKDVLLKPTLMQELLYKMENNEIEILIGTQIITKGYHFPNLTLVGIVDADLGLIGGDLRAAERSFQLLHQVGGRAGRETLPGRVLLQTYYPDHMVFQSITQSAGDAFMEYELCNRRDANLPPFTKIASIILSSKDENTAYTYGKQLVSVAPTGNIKILGPAKCLVAKLAGKYRYRMLVIADKKLNLQQYLQFWLSQIARPHLCAVRIDIDPQNFL